MSVSCPPTPRPADVGPPSRVVLSRAGGVLDVAISDPLTSTNGSMREILPELYFVVRYWEDSADSQVELKPKAPAEVT